MTLIEVVAGLALLGTLLVGVLMAKSRYGHQWVTANRRIEAALAADRLLSEWWEDPAALPRNARGTLPGSEGLYWQTREVEVAAAQKLQAQVVRLEVFDAEPDRAGFADQRPILLADLLLPKKVGAP